jgi:hypothetical protein
MKKPLIFKLLIIAACAATVFAGASIDFFQVSPDGDNAILEWRTSNETNLQDFVVQKGTPQSNFIDIATISLNNDHYYTYVDKSIYKTNDAVCIYRIKIVDQNGSVTYSRTASLSVISGVKRTWGSIKAMFR